MEGRSTQNGRDRSPQGEATHPETEGVRMLSVKGRVGCRKVFRVGGVRGVTRTEAGNRLSEAWVVVLRAKARSGNYLFMSRASRPAPWEIAWCRPGVRTQWTSGKVKLREATGAVRSILGASVAQRREPPPFGSGSSQVGEATRLGNGREGTRL